MSGAVGIEEIERARDRLDGVARVTPVQPSETLSRLAGRPVLLKAEIFQRTGAFKIRGAYNTIAQLSEAERRAGVVAASAGNHGQAVAWAAREEKAHATVFVPQDAPMAKVDATRSYGAHVRMEGEGFDEALEASLAFADERGATFVHAFEDAAVIAGQGTIGLELAEQLPDVETFLVPVGGGGLAAGISLALRAVRPGARIVGVQSQPGFTIADGIMVKHPGELTMSILERTLDDLVRVTDEQIGEAIVLLLERTKLVVEGAGAVGLAALFGGLAGGAGPVGVLLSGGNIDPTMLISIVRHGLTESGRYLVLRTRVPDRPGELVKLLNLIAEQRGNVVSVEHHREGMSIGVTQTEVELTVVTRDGDHCETLLAALAARGYETERLS
jgi:threonine dehydratase